MGSQDYVMRIELDAQAMAAREVTTSDVRNALRRDNVELPAGELTDALRTLPVRAKAQSESALDIAKRLAAHPKVARVDYPGLEEHPGHAIAKTQQDGFGPLMSLELKGGAEAARRFVLSLELFILAQSLGGVESLCAIPATMTHAAMTPEAREEAGVADGLVRLSVGLEAADALWADLEQALGGL